MTATGSKYGTKSPLNVLDLPGYYLAWFAKSTKTVIICPFQDVRTLEPKMNRISSLYSSSIGKKSIAAITGLLLLGFLVGHVPGNLKVFTGSAANGVPHIDEYGQFLKELGKPVLPHMVGLWIARVGLLVCLVLHVIVVAQLAMQSKLARPSKYVRSEKVASSIAARWMMYSNYRTT